MTKEKESKLITLLKEMRANKQRVADIYERGDDEERAVAKRFKLSARCLQEVIWLIEDEEFFNTMWQTYMEDDK